MRITFFIILVLASLSAKAGNIACHGPVVIAMGDHPGCTDSNGKIQMAFKTNYKGNPWMCASSDVGTSMVLTAIVADKDVGVWISDSDKGYTCSTLPQYSKISYVVFYK